ncbi:MAG: GntR family transcriptional regulator [Ruminococcaceae bacterium]|nr:GntR family transcriptional regulator [Oscillospiraceae bacterium]
MQLKFSGKQDVYLEIAEKYKEYIRLGVIRDGEKLPSVREAAVELGVNPNTVARAYSRLEEEGYVQSLPKKGAYVTYDVQSGEGAPDRRAEIRDMRDMGISKQTLLNWIEEVYSENDRD